MASQQQVFKLGKSTIVVHDDEFADGYTNGSVAYPNTAQETLFTVEHIRQIITESFLDGKHTGDWNIGYIVGAISGIREGSHYDDHLECPQVQLGAGLLRFNRWRFREGYLNGQLDYEAGKETHPSPHVLTARDLLCYIAHYDPDTNMYSFAKDQIATLEETLGQLIGYFCAALFWEQEPTTGPLQLA